MLQSTANTDHGSKLTYKYKLYLKSNNGEFSSGIVIRLSAVKLDVTNGKNRSKHPKDNITSTGFKETEVAHMLSS